MDKKCPQCAENVKAEAKVCRHCGHTFSDASIAELKRRNRLGCVVGVILLVGLLVAIGKCSGDNPAKQNGASVQMTDMSGKPKDAGAADTKAEPVSLWSYSEDKDQMRGTSTKFAILDSDNEVEMPFPYNGGVKGHIIIRRRAQDGLQVLFTVDKGQILCSEYQSSHVLHVKFDNGAVRAYACSNASDGTSETAFIEGKAGFLAGLKHSKKAMVEAQMYDAGGQQWAFNTAGLVWK